MRALDPSAPSGAAGKAVVRTVITFFVLAPHGLDRIAGVISAAQKCRPTPP